MAETDIAKEMERILLSYTKEVEADLEEAKKTIAREGAADLRATSPVGATGEYKKGWTYKKNRDGSYTIYNKNKPQLTHLLEKGHAKVGGGRVSGTPHIALAEERIEEAFIKEVERRVGG